MTSEGLAERLRTRWLGRSLRIVDETGSTHVDALELARAGAPSGTVLVADRQTAGRGRLGRSWHSPPGRGLYVSIVLRPSLEPERMAPLAVATGVVLAAVLEDFAQVPARLKWPNDIWVHDRKVAGILAELVSDVRSAAVVLGLGINANGPRAELPPELRVIATTLESERDGRPVDRSELLARLLGDLEPAIEHFEREGFAPFVAEANRRSALAGREVRVELGERGVVGRVGDIGPDARLRVVPAEGPPLAMAFGEVTLVRPIGGDEGGARAQGVEPTC